MGLFAVSYDPVAILAAFGDTHGITFPLLSDEGSHAMRGLGLLNERVGEDHAVYGIPASSRHVGLPYPGTFVLDEAGIIVHKRFHESYRVRDTGAGLLARTLGMLDAGSEIAGDDGADAVRLRTWIASPTYVWYQQLHLNVEIMTAAGWHVYGRPAALGVVPVTVDIEPIEGTEIGTIDWPAPHALRLAGMDETVWAYDGRLQLTVPLTFTGAPGAGDRRIAGAVRYQACSESVCLPPTTIPIEITLAESALVGRSLPPRAGSR